MLGELMGWPTTATVCAAEGHRDGRQRGFTAAEVARLAGHFQRLPGTAHHAVRELRRVSASRIRLPDLRSLPLTARARPTGQVVRLARAGCWPPCPPTRLAQPGARAGRRAFARSRQLAVSAAFGAWLRRQREARGWSRTELARRMADAVGSAVTAPAHVLECYLSRWEAGHVAISARYRQLLDAVLGPGASAPAEHPASVPPDPRKWVRAMRAIESGIADGQWKPGDLSCRPARRWRSGTA